MRRAEQNGNEPGRSNLLRSAALVAASAAILTAFVVAAGRAKPWRLSAYSVRGLNYLTAEEVLQAAGLKMGDNLFGADVRAAEARLRTHPRILEATVRRRLPGEIIISIKERRPAALVIIDGQLYKLAADGVVLGPAGDRYEDLPLLAERDYRARGAVIGRKLNVPEIRDALAFITALEETDSRWWARLDFVGLPRRVAVFDGGERIVRFGVSCNTQSVKRLVAVFAVTHPGPGTLVYDIRFGNDVIVNAPPRRAPEGGSEDGGAV